MNHNPLEKDIALLIIETLKLEGMSIDEIEPELPLFGDGLGLDSIDALELGIAIQKKYEVQIDANDESTKQQFATVRSLAAFVEAHRGDKS
jgi:acyl carrier protein